MLDKDLFIRMMTTADKFDNEIERWSDFGIELYEQPIYDLPWEMFNIWLKCHFDVEGQDWVNWYLFERISYATGQVLPCYNEDGSEFYVRSYEDLWRLVKSHQLQPATIDTPCKFNSKEKCTAL